MTSEQQPATERIVPGSLAFVFAHAEEAAGLKRKLDDRVTTRCVSLLEHCGTWQQSPVVIAETGGGFERAERATRDLIIMRRPRWIIATGFAASLQPGVEIGHIVMPDQVCNQQGETWPVECHADKTDVQARPTLHVGSLLSLPAFPTTEEERQSLFKSQQALACDTQTQAVADVCRREQVPFLSARIIDRDVAQGLAADLESVDRRPTRAGKLGAAARTLFQRPGSIQDMWQRKKEARKLSDRLGRFLLGMVEQLQQWNADEKMSPRVNDDGGTAD
ncbi:MAG: hypothetical protein VB877_02605 [Pirellulaceae bacterium]